VRVLDLFSGIGGFSLGLERAGMRTVAFCEIDPYCRNVLRKHWPDVPIHDDIRTLRVPAAALELPPVIDVICGGYPCFPYSVAGKRMGEKDDRHLWPEMLRLITECRTTWVIGENVAGHVSLGLDGVLSDLEASGYSQRAFVIPACAVGAPHSRARVWIVAHAERERGCGREPAGGHAMDADPCSEGSGPGTDSDWWATEPQVDRLVDGLPGRLAGLCALGNAVVPQVVEVIGRAIMRAASCATVQPDEHRG
jgi:DNA (cytosine-5)-methyltransferase 1